MRKLTVEESFDQQHAVDPVTGCHVWQRARGKEGYGQLWVGGTSRRAHRYAYERVHGPVSEEFQVCHRCDNPSCVNVAHLFVGTGSDNMRDAHRKGRAANPVFHGEEHGMAILTERKVLRIRERIAQGARQVDVARSMGVSPELVYRIKKRIIWKHI